MVEFQPDIETIQVWSKHEGPLYGHKMYGCIILPELHADLFSRRASPFEVGALWPSTKEVKMLCPMRFVVDATENSKEGGVAADVCSSQTGL